MSKGFKYTSGVCYQVLNFFI